MGLHPWEFWDYTPVEFYHKTSGWVDEKEILRNRSWEQLRVIAALIYNAFAPENKKKSATQIMPFPWDPETTTKNRPLSKEEREQLFGKMDRHFKKQYESGLTGTKITLQDMVKEWQGNT